MILFLFAGNAIESNETTQSNEGKKVTFDGKKECNTQCKFSSKILVHWGKLGWLLNYPYCCTFSKMSTKLSKGCTKGFKTLRRQHFITLYHQLVLQSEIWIQGPLFAKSAKQMLYYGSHFHSRPYQPFITLIFIGV